MLHIVARPCSPALSPLIAAFHYHRGVLPAAVERIMPSGQAHLMINLDDDEFRTYCGPDVGTACRLGGTVLAGPHGTSVAIDTMEQGWLMAVEFKVGGAASFFPMPIAETRDQVIELGNLWGREGARVRERICEAASPADKFRILEAILLKHFIRPKNPAIAAATFLLTRGLSVADVRSQVGLTPRTFVRRFRDQVGLTPKRFSRVLRLQRILDSVVATNGVNWCRVAAEHGYTDQAHFIHDFRDLTGITPTSYGPSSPSRRNHVPVAKLER